MKLGLIIQSNDPETVWNAFRFANTSLDARHSVRIFLLGKGVEVEGLQNRSFDVKGVMKEFLSRKGEMYACGTCLESRKLETNICPVSTMSELLEIVDTAYKVLVF